MALRTKTTKNTSERVRLVLTVNFRPHPTFAHENPCYPTNCPWVSEDGIIVVGAPVPQRDQIGRKRRLSETLSPEKLIEQNEEAIKALKRHSDRGSCPKSLQYKACARIRADNDFKSGIKRISNQAEQGIVRALTSFHERQIQKHRIALKRQTRPIAPGDTKVVHRSTDGNKNRSEIAHSANSDTNVTTEHLG